MLTRRGTNQYQVKHKHPTKQWLGMLLTVTFLVSLVPLTQRIEKAVAFNITSPIPEESIIREAYPVYIDTSKVRPVTEQEEIESYIKTIFGKDAKVAIAISHKECSPQNKSYPQCVLSTEKEHSVGIFQINIQSRSAKVHSARIPGDTLAEKEQWLKNPKNNTLMAFWIFEKSGWNPWTAYTSGAYLEELK